MMEECKSLPDHEEIITADKIINLCELVKSCIHVLIKLLIHGPYMFHYMISSLISLLCFDWGHTSPESRLWFHVCCHRCQLLLLSPEWYIRTSIVACQNSCGPISTLQLIGNGKPSTYLLYQIEYHFGDGSHYKCFWGQIWPQGIAKIKDSGNNCFKSQFLID